MLPVGLAPFSPVYSTSLLVDHLLVQLQAMNENQIHHVIYGSRRSNHYWERLVPNRDWDEIDKIIRVVIQTGQDQKYKKIFKRTKRIEGEPVEVVYLQLKDGSYKLSNAWINFEGKML